MNGSVDWDALTGFQFKLLWKAIIDDFTFVTLNAALVADLGRQPLANYAPPMADYPAQAFELIQKAKMQGWTRELIDGLVAANPGAPRLRRFQETVGLTADIAKPAPAGWKLQDLLNPKQDFLKPDGWLTKLAMLRRRVCRIEHVNRPADKPGFGTGWLIGPDLLITNYHVIHTFKPAAGNGADVAGVTCRFDVTEPPTTGKGRECKFAADWLVDGSPPGAAEREEGTAAPTEAELDYAVIRLAEAVGDDEVEQKMARGQVDLGTHGAAPGQNDVLLVVQHPEGLPQRFAFGNAKDSLKPEDLRLQHTANTLKGSSGSPVVNIDLAIVALHQAGGDGTGNQCVPIERVAARLAVNGVLPV
ncbi:serine protease [Mesorhizobium sp. M0924]|uniref:trypsin-like peptidase domain-containing protein n=1 Tax=unclassified Mesorhizobium TaxID=325217 RepID=UPI00333B279F